MDTIVSVCFSEARLSDNDRYEERTAIGVLVLVPRPTLPTAIHIVADVHDTLLSELIVAPAGLGSV